MSKVKIAKLDSVTNNDTTATLNINNNFTAIQAAIENTLSRDGTSPNYMQADLDMNSKRIINLGDPVEDSDVTTLGYLKEEYGDVKAYSETAVTASNRAQGYAQSAEAYASNASKSAAQAEADADYIRNDEDFNTVAADLASDTSNIKITAGSIDNVNTVAGSIDNVNLTGESIASVNTTAGSIDNVNITAESINNVNKTGESILDVNAVASSIDNVDKVAADLTNVDTVAADITDVSTVAGIKDDVVMVSGIAMEVADVAGIAEDVTSVANNMDDVKAAVESAAEAKSWAIGSITERTEGSAKYWAEQAQAIAQIDDATEETKGIVKLSTEALADAGTDNTTAMTPLKVANVVADSVGKGIVVGFDGTLSGSELLFAPTDIYNTTFKENFDYEIDLNFAVAGSVDDSVSIKLVDSNLTSYTIRNALSGDTAATFGDLRQVMRYDDEVGYRWRFNARYKVDASGNNVLLIPSTVINLAQEIDTSTTRAPSNNAVKAVTDTLVTLDTEQTITGAKTFTTAVYGVTPSDVSDSSTKYTTTAWVNNLVAALPYQYIYHKRNSDYYSYTHIDMCNAGLGFTDVFVKNTLIISGFGVTLSDGTYFNSTANSMSGVEFLPLSNCDATPTAGSDAYVYVLKLSDGTYKYWCSMNSTEPTEAHTAYAKIGGFHCECVSVTSANAWNTIAVGIDAGDIVPNSVWCTTFRPIAKPEGMAYVDVLDKWADIYLQSGTLSNTASVYGGTITDTRYPQNHYTDATLVNKRYITDYEFTCAALGSPEKVAIKGAADPVTTGGHVATNSQRIISAYFLEDCTGVVWQWLSNDAAGGSSWTTIALDDSRSGSTYGTGYCLHGGGSWDDSSYCGVGCRDAAGGRSTLSVGIGARFVSLPKVPVIR